MGSQIAAFFDVDNTLIRGASAYYLARELYRRDFFSARDIVFAARQATWYNLFGEDLDRVNQVRERALQAIRGHAVAEVISIGEEVYAEVLEPRIMAGPHAILQEHLRAGHEVWLVTATPQEISDHIAAHLGATGSLGTRAEHVDGIYTGRLSAPFLHGQAKAEAARELAAERGLDLAASYAYGDSFNDVHILGSVGYPVAINPERHLRRHAQEHGWEIRDFDSPRSRRYRQRLVGSKAGRRRRLASAAGAVWVASAVWRSLRSR